MITVEEKSNGSETKAKPGRPPKQQVTKGNSEPVKYVFKSKFRGDRLTIEKPQMFKMSDGSMRVTPARHADFTRNTYTTEDKEVAKNIRDQIKQRDKAGDPLHVIETTQGA